MRRLCHWTFVLQSEHISRDFHESVSYVHKLPGAKNQVLGALGWSLLSRLAGERALSNQQHPQDSKCLTKDNTVQVQVGSDKVRYIARSIAHQVIGDLTRRYGAGRLLTADGVGILTPLLALEKGEYTYEPDPAIDFTFKWTDSDDEVFEEVVRLNDQSDLIHVLKVPIRGGQLPPYWLKRAVLYEARKHSTRQGIYPRATGEAE
ncbi:hypothetical protein KFL_000570340 [Klebsormidium nitens]|uniref:Uncharacterized protein n=1 Tax=Klebsormidium nitens TaxID=105231 RepID=A0A0U9HU04_KLENI|nr:hypothetical protein KFL_000570340 [Klebsormidium nitens]|eukprot:GAQ80587.1 hypothetical protein KFL_000570340 [Klebsormidium nitens]